MQKYIKLDNPSVSILVTGKTGVGKSTLVNALIGMEVAITGKTKRGVTDKVETHKKIRNGVHIHVCDTPGLASLNKDDSDILHDALKECKNVDLLLFCLRMTDTRFNKYQVREMELVTSIFGRDIWKKGMIILTHANDMPNDTKTFNEELEGWQDVIRDTVIDREVFDPEVAEKIPIVPTGFEELQLPDITNWLSEFWVQGFRRMRFEPMWHLIALNKKRMRSKADGNIDMHQNPKDQPLIVCDMSIERLIDPKHFLLLSTLIGTAIGSVVGMGIGSIPLAAAAGTSCMGIASIAYQAFGWIETEVDCFQQALEQSLIAAFLDEHPEVLQSPEYKELFTKLNVS